MAADVAVSLPLELRVLADFLETDDRPTAILGPGTESHKINVVYENSAFSRLGLVDFDVDQLVQRFRPCEIRESSRSLHGVRDDEFWRLKDISGGWHALVGGVKGKNAEDRTNHSPETEFNDSGIDLETSAYDEAITETPNAVTWGGPHDEDSSSWSHYVRTFDWDSTELGPFNEWPEALQGYVMHILSNPNPRVICWGDSQVLIYNEACIPLYGEKHPWSLGKPASAPWAEIWNEFGPLVQAAYQGKVTELDNEHFAIRRNGFLEETYWKNIILPIPSPHGHINGAFLELVETTKTVLGERRQASIIKLSQHIGAADTLDKLFSSYLQPLEETVEDVPYALLYAVVDDTPDRASDSSNLDQFAKKCMLKATVGIPDDNSSIDPSFTLEEQDGSDFIEPFVQAWKTRSPITLSSEDGTLPASLRAAVPGRAFGDEINKAILTPVMSHGDAEILAFLVVSLNPRTSLDDEYKLYMHFLSDILIKAASLISLPQEQRRAQKLADEMNTTLAHQLRLLTLQAERMEARFKRMASEAPTGMFVYDPHGRPLYVNGAYLRMLKESNEGHSASSVAMSWTEHIHSDDLQRFLDAWKRVVEQKAPLTIDYRLKEPWVSVDKTSGQEMTGERWLLMNAFPDVDSDGSISSIQGWLTDISHRKFTEGLAAQKLEDALENRRQTENFIDMTSHEMRNPLSAMLQSADSIVSSINSADMLSLDGSMVLSRDGSAEILDAVQTIILCAQHQKRIIDDILTLSKLDASLLVICPDKVQPPALLEKALRMFSAETNRAGITAEVVIEPTYDELRVDWVVLDPSRLLQVIINLLTNAIKFTQYCDERKISICLGASYERPTGRHHKVNFIPTKHIRPANSPLSEWGEGENLFLQIAVTDTGRGLNEDEMKVLFQRFSQASPKTYSQYGGSGLGLFISRELCELQGGQIGVSSGPGKTTFTFFVRAKRWLDNGHADKLHRPILPRFTSASASPVSFSRRGSAVLNEGTGGAEAQLSRVPSISEVDEGLRGVAAISGHVPRQGTRVTGNQLHVLIVEDNFINQKVMSQQLRRAGCIVHVANHGLECLEFLERSAFCSAEVPLSLILLDLEMPTMDGLTCIQLIRERQVSGKIIGHVPVIAVTANARSEQIAKAIDAGMDQVVTKPFRIPDLLPQMHELLAEVAQRNGDG